MEQQKLGSNGTIKRPTAPTQTSPTRPFKRLREAFSPKSPKHPKSPGTCRPSTSHSHSHPRSPTKIPLPTSPIDKSLPLPPSEVEDVLASFRFSRTHLNRSIDALEGIKGELLAERAAGDQLRGEVENLSAEKKKKDSALLEAWGEAEDLRTALKRARAERGKAAQESQGMINHLESRLVEANSTITSLRSTLTSISDSKRELEEAADRRLFTLQEELDTAQQEMVRMRLEYTEMRLRVEEAEFTQRALKEGGARLARELAEREKRVDELERAKAAKRGGMV